ncbi:hypothetical protein BC936DRAFT_147207 [Jimgerdemannia flammicorona]|uniref:Transmembrane protein 242 n=1 Tax=Jimgerdemannia flammicorona TaxID=994334 RepID=A0A433D5V5_9FUNG|nr:hypothetical protein BC936DRAFT_147207 [Jimgerdemannia flammicorona]
MVSATTPPSSLSPPPSLQPSVSYTTILTASGIAFLGGIGGSIWYSRRKLAKENALAATTPTSASQRVQAVAPVLTPSELRRAHVDVGWFALKALGLGTLLAVGTTGTLAVAVGWWLDVRNGPI